MRILFMGTPDIAAESLAALLGAGHEVCAVFTRRDKPVGRKQILTAPPVKQLAQQHDIPVYQPRTLRDGSSDALIQQLAPDIIVVVAYGCIIPPQLLHVAKYGCINLHVSLLPKYRGSAPIQWAVLNGDAETGVSIMQMDEGLTPAMCGGSSRSPSTLRKPAANCLTASAPWAPRHWSMRWQKSRQGSSPPCRRTTARQRWPRRFPKTRPALPLPRMPPTSTTGCVV